MIRSAIARRIARKSDKAATGKSLGIRASRLKMTAIRASARDEECTLRFPGVCNWRTDTTVLCHENGAGAGMKSADEAGVYGCCDCHRVLDGQAPRPPGFSREAMLAMFAAANAQTRAILRRKGLLATEGDLPAQREE